MCFGKAVYGRLRRCIDGTREAGALRDSTYTAVLIKMGFVQGASSPCCFRHDGWGASLVVHGDDFTELGTPTGLDKYEKGMANFFECKFRGRLGHGPNWAQLSTWNGSTSDPERLSNIKLSPEATGLHNLLIRPNI